MAQRRMFSLKIINSARFLKMPVSSQLLYFHLGLNADDDGIVEGYNVIKMTNCTEDDLKILVAKELVIVLNADLVSFITDWKEHNSIRPDRKIDSIYKELLLQMVTDVKLLESKPRADLKSRINTIKEDGQPMGNQRTSNGQHRLGKVRLGKYRLGKIKVGKYKTEIKKGKQKSFSSDSDEYRLSNFLCNYIKNNNKEAKEPNMQKWSKTFDLMIRLDNRDIEGIKKAIIFSQKNEFWYKNILSPDKLRKHYDTLVLQMKEPKYEKSKGKGQFVENCEARDYDFDELEKKLLAGKVEAKEMKTGINIYDYE